MTRSLKCRLGNVEEVSNSNEVSVEIHYNQNSLSISLCVFYVHVCAVNVCVRACVRSSCNNFVAKIPIVHLSMPENKQGRACAQELTCTAYIGQVHAPK